MTTVYEMCFINKLALPCLIQPLQASTVMSAQATSMAAMASEYVAGDHRPSTSMPSRTPQMI